MSEILARRYARAVFGIAVARSTTAAFQRELDAIVSAAAVCEDLQWVLADEEIPFKKRERVVDALAPVLQLSSTTISFLKVLIAKRRIALLQEIGAAYRQLAAEREGTVTAEVTSAFPLRDAAALQGIEAAVARLTRRKVILQARTDPTLIGGVVVRVGDTVYDGSLATELHRIRDRLLHT